MLASTVQFSSYERPPPRHRRQTPPTPTQGTGKRYTAERPARAGPPPPPQRQDRQPTPGETRTPHPQPHRQHTPADGGSAEPPIPQDPTACQAPPTPRPTRSHPHQGGCTGARPGMTGAEPTFHPRAPP